MTHQTNNRDECTTSSSLFNAKAQRVQSRKGEGKGATCLCVFAAFASLRQNMGDSRGQNRLYPKPLWPQGKRRWFRPASGAFFERKLVKTALPLKSTEITALNCRRGVLPNCYASGATALEPDATACEDVGAAQRTTKEAAVVADAPAAAARATAVRAIAVDA